MTTINSDKWYDFMELAQASLLQGQSVDTYKPTIQFAIEPSFANHIFLQLELVDETLWWYRTTWLKLEDAPKFTNPLENIKFIGQIIEPTIKKESGRRDINSLKHILGFIETISIKPRIKKWGGMILDGTYYTLTIGAENMQTTYKWHYLPDEWADLQKLANMLEELNQNL